jgi:hypothetical protein
MWTKENSIFTVYLVAMSIRSACEAVFNFVHRLPDRALRTAHAALA